MTVLVTKAVTLGVRGKLSRWMLEVDAGVFVGNIPARVRDKLWERLFSKLGTDGAAVLIYASSTEQGFSIRTHGVLDRTVVDFEGIALMRFKQVRKRSKSQDEAE